MINPNHSFKKQKYPPRKKEKTSTNHECVTVLAPEFFGRGLKKKTPSNPPKNTTTTTRSTTNPHGSRLKESRFTFDQFRAEFLQGPRVRFRVFGGTLRCFGWTYFLGLVNKTFGGWFSAGWGWVEFYNKISNMMYSTLQMFGFWLKIPGNLWDVRGSSFFGGTYQGKKPPTMLYRSKNLTWFK